MSLVILGPLYLDNNIDVYLCPLILELEELLIDGVDIYDHSEKQTFRIGATFLWTISTLLYMLYCQAGARKGLCHVHLAIKKRSIISLLQRQDIIQEKYATVVLSVTKAYLHQQNGGAYHKVAKCLQLQTYNVKICLLMTNFSITKSLFPCSVISYGVFSNI